jgi:NADH:ubiquinone oxidoreductase subunit E
MNQSDTEITICMGSSCFSRGNKGVLQAIKTYLKENDLEPNVLFKGAHCLGLCERGPMITINGKQFFQVDSVGIILILDAHFSSINQE